MPPNARASLQSVAGYPERSLPGYPVDPLPREPREYAHSKPTVVQPGNGLLVDHLTPAYHLPIHAPATDCSCHEPQPDCVNHAFSIDTVEQHARTERDYPSDDEKRLHAMKPKAMKAAKQAIPTPPRESRHVHVQSTKTSGRESRCETHRRASFDALEDLERNTSEYKHFCENRCRRRSSLDALHSDSESESDSARLDEVRRAYLLRKLKRDYLDDLHTYVEREEPRKTEKAKTAGWYNEAVRLIRRSRSASGESCSSHSSTSSPRFDTADIEKQLLKVRKRIRKVKLAYGSDGEEKTKQNKKRGRSRSRSTERRKRSPSSSSSSSSDSECQREISAREQQADDKIRRKELERLLQRRRKARGQTSSRSGSEVRIDRMQLRNKPVQVGPPAKPPWRYWRNDPPPTLLAPPTFDAYHDTSQPVNSVELHPVRASSAKLAPKGEKTAETITRKPQGYIDREQQILQRRFEEAMRREEERQEKRASKYDQRNSDALRALNPEAAQAKVDKERSALRDRIQREYSSKRGQVMQREMAAELQREAARTRLAAERAAAQAVLDQRRAEQHAQALRERNQGDQQLRLARVACEEAARMHSELSRTNAETAHNLRKYEVRKEVNQGYLSKLRVDPALS